MEIEIEIGSNDQKELIASELKNIKTLIGHLDPSPLITHLIVPRDFDEKVNKIQGTESYHSKRRHNIALAKNIDTESGICLVFSRDLYTDLHDKFTRLHIYCHELFHAFNKIRFPSLITKSYSEYQYLANLYTLFDEYDANRKSFKFVEKIFPDTSPRYKFDHRIYLKRFIKSLLDSSEHYDKIRWEITKFRIHGKVDSYSDRINPYFDDVSKSIVYVYSYIDHWNKLQRLQPLLMQSKFINKKTMDLIDFFRLKFDENNPDLLDGDYIISNFMENFGMRFEDTKEGLYCHVLNI